MKRRIYAIVALLTLAAFVLGACAPAPAAEEEGPAVADVKAPADVQMPEYEAPEGEEEEAPADGRALTTQLKRGSQIPIRSCWSRIPARITSPILTAA